MTFNCSFLVPLKKDFCKITIFYRIIITKIAPVRGKENIHIQGWLEERCLVTSYCDKELKTRGFGI